MTTLTAGDIAIIGYTSEGAASSLHESVSFVLLRDIDAGTSIKFTDTEWAGNNLTQGEGALEWLASSNMTAGTVVRIESTSDTSDPAFPTATIGTVATTTDGGFFTGSFSPSSSGDPIIAYQGTAGGALTAITAFINRDNGFVPAQSGSDSELPTGLTEGVNALHFINTATNNEFDNGYYNGITSGPLSVLRAAIHNPANWAGSDDPIPVASSPGSFTIGGALSPQEILISGNGTEIVLGDTTPRELDNTAFGPAEVAGGMVTKTFTITNTGGTDLTLTGAPLVTVSGSSAFTVSSQPGTNTIAGSSSTTFQVTFDPSQAGVNEAVISVSNDDSDEGTYTFNVTGSGALSVGGTSMAAGDAAIVGYDGSGNKFAFVLLKDVVAGTVLKFTDGGWQAAGGYRAEEGAVQWTAPQDMSAGAIVNYDSSLANFARDFKQVTDGGYFTGSSGFEPSSGGDQIYIYQGTASANPATYTPIGGIHYDGTTFDADATSGTTSAVPTGLTNGVNVMAFGQDATTDFASGAWNVSTQPDIATLRSAIYNTSNWSGSDASPYQVMPTGTVTIGTPEPEIGLEGSGLSIISGDTTPAKLDDTDVGHQDVAGGASTTTFTIRNTGGADLTLGTITATGTNGADFGINQPSSATVAAGGSVTFQVNFDPSAGGARSATINIPSDDSDEAIFTFAVSGNGRAPSGGTSLSAGDVAVTGFNTSGTDSFTFVILEDIVAGTSIKFSDGGWDGTTFRTGEGALEWIAPSDMSAGTVTQIDFQNLDTSPHISVAPDSHFTSNFSMGSAGDQILIYQGTADASGTSITNLGAVQYDKNVFDTTFTENTGVSLLPTGLTLGTSAIALGTGASGSGTEADNAIYTGVTQGSKATLQAALNNPANWTISANEQTLSTTAFSFGNPPSATLPTSVTLQEDQLTALDLRGIVISDTDETGTMSITLTASEGTFSGGSDTGVTPSLSAGNTVLTLTGTLADLNAALAKAISTVSYQPVANDAGSPAATITVTLDDLDGSPVANAGTINVDITPVNDAPTGAGAPTSLGFIEDTQTNFNISSIGIADVDSASITVTITVNSGTFATPVDGAGVGGGVTATLDSSTVVRLVGAPNDVDSYLNTATNLKYTPPSNVNGAGVAQFSILGNDNDGSGDVVFATNVPINVVAVNDVPTVSGLSTNASVTEDTLSDLDLSSVSIADVDSAQITVTLTLSPASIFAAPADGAGVGGGVTAALQDPSTITLTGAPADISAYLDTASHLKITPPANVHGVNAASVQISANDGDGSGNVVLGSVGIDVTGVNDAPTGTGVPSSLSGTEDTVMNVDLSSLGLTDVDSSSVTLTVTVSAGVLSAPLDGTASGVTASLVDPTTVTLVGGAANISTYLDGVSNLRYTPAANVNGPNVAQITLSVNDGDGSGDVLLANSLAISLLPVNDAPVISGADNTPAVRAGQTVQLDDNMTISDVELDALNGGAGDYTGASLTVGRNIATNGDDLLSISTGGNIVVDTTGNTVATTGGDVFASFVVTSGQIVVSFNSTDTPATQALVNEVLQSLTYGNAGSGSGTVDLAIAFDDGTGSNASQILSVTMDQQPPVAPSQPDLVSASDAGTFDSDNVTNDDTPTFSITAEDGSTVTLISDIAGIVGTGVASGGTAQITTSVLSAGIHSFTATATDAAGNVSPVSAPISVTIETTAPSDPTPGTVSSDTGSSATDAITSDGTVLFGSSTEPFARVEVFLNTISIGTVDADAAGDWELDYSATTLADGNYQVTAQATDLAGNTSAIATVLNLVIDGAAPTLSEIDLVDGSDTGSSNSDNLTGDTTPTIAFQAEAGSSLFVDFDDGRGFQAQGVATGGVQMLTLDAAYTTEGAKSIQVRAQDAAGNQVVRSVSVTINFAPTDLTLSASDVVENSTSGTVIGTFATVDATVGDTHTLTLTDDAGGLFELQGGSLAVATGAEIDFETAQFHDVTLQTSDGIGNTFSKTFRIDVSNVQEGPAGSTEPGSAVETHKVTAEDTILFGAPEVLDGDTISGFGTEDRIQIDAEDLDSGQITFSGDDPVVVTIDPDGTGPQPSVASFTVQGDFSGGEFMAVEVDDQTYLTFETYLPTLGEGQGVETGVINGINNQDFLTGDGTMNFRTNLDPANAGAGFDNSLGVYEIDSAGNVVDVRVLFGNVKGSETSSDITSVEAGHKLGFFLIQDGADWVDDLELSDTLSFVDRFDGSAGNISDANALRLAVNGAEADVMVFHSYSSSLNVDGVQHALSGVNVGGQSITVGFEDLTGGGDQDYQDVIFQVETFTF